MTEKEMETTEERVLGKVTRYLPAVITVLSLVGIVDTIYLLDLHYSSRACPVDGQVILGYVVDCGAIAASQYSELWGIPIALFGFLYYFAIFVLTNYQTTIDNLISKYSSAKWLTSFSIASGMVGFALLVSIYLFYLQIGKLELICTYCMGSVFTTLFLAISHGFIYYDNFSMARM